ETTPSAIPPPDARSRYRFFPRCGRSIAASDRDRWLLSWLARCLGEMLRGLGRALADRRHRAVMAGLAHKDRGGRRIGHLAVRRIDLDAAQMRMVSEISHGVELGERDIGIGETLQEVVPGHGRKAVADDLVGELAVAHALDHVGKSWVVGKRRLSQHI